MTFEITSGSKGYFMDKKRLEYFVTLAQMLHFGAAAEKLSIAQSALSRQMQILEGELECQLFDRSNRWNVSLTSAGKIFLAEAERLLNQMAGAKKLTAAVARGEAGKLFIELVPAAVNVASFLATLRQLQNHYEGLHLSIGTSISTVIYEKVRNKEADLGIVRMAPLSTEELQMDMLANDRLVAAIPEKHPLAAKKLLYLSDLHNARFILQSSHDATPLRSMLDVICRNAGFEPKTVMEIENLTTLLALLPVFNAVTILPESFTGYNTSLCYRHLEDCGERLPLSVVYRKDNPSPILRKFLKSLAGKVSGLKV